MSAIANTVVMIPPTRAKRRTTRVRRPEGS
jgi:hypothetical protein